MTSKKCSKCGIEKELTQFGNQKQGLFGKRSSCRECSRLQFNAWYAHKSKMEPEWAEKRKMDAINWAINNPEKRSIIAKRRNIKEKNQSPDKIKARALVNQRVRFGRIPKASSLTCINCGKQANHYHHHKGYSFEFRYDVVPVCHSCHRILG